MVCIFCGKSIPTNASQCPHCKRRLSAFEDEEDEDSLERDERFARWASDPSFAAQPFEEDEETFETPFQAAYHKAWGGLAALEAEHIKLSVPETVEEKTLPQKRENRGSPPRKKPQLKVRPKKRIRASSMTRRLSTVTLCLSALSLLLSLAGIGERLWVLYSLAALLLVIVVSKKARFDSIYMFVPYALLMARHLILEVGYHGNDFSALGKSGNSYRFLSYAALIWMVLMLMKVIRERGVRVTITLGLFSLCSLILLFACLSSLLAKRPVREILSLLSHTLFLVCYCLTIYTPERQFLRKSLIRQLTQPSYEPEADGYPHYEHPYHQLGGWLKFILVMFFVLCVILFLRILSITGRVVSMSSSVGGLLGYFRIGMENVFWEMVLVDLVCLFLIASLASVYSQIRRKLPTFLLSFHFFAVLGILLSFLERLVFSGFWKAFLLVALEAIFTFALTLYFVSSVRVRTYMGTSSYIPLSPFTRNTPAPWPADSQPYEKERRRPRRKSGVKKRARARE